MYKYCLNIFNNFFNLYRIFWDILSVWINQLTTNKMLIIIKILIHLLIKRKYVRFSYVIK